MRTIRFRGKNINTNEWVNGDLVVEEDGMHNVVRAKIITHCFTKSFQGGGFDHYSISTLVEPKTIGQFTGLLDKNGKEIYEGDIVNVRVTDDRYKMDPRFRNGVVTFCEYDGGWMVECYDRFLPKRMEVVGNIHDNPELLKNND